MNQLEYDTFLFHKEDYLKWRQALYKIDGSPMNKNCFTYKQQGKRKLKCPHGHMTVYSFNSIYFHEMRGTLYLRDVKKIKPNYDTVDTNSPKILNWV